MSPKTPYKKQIMNNEEIEKVMQFVRIDGLATAPVCFLTIEDGGELEQEEFVDYITGNPNWIPTEIDRPLTQKNTGVPGEFISKIMTFAFGDLCGVDNDWRDYRAKRLYSSNECNIKYYPIGRRNTSIWPEWLSKKLGISASEYVVQCLAERPEILSKKCKHYSSGERLFIVIGARDEWSYVLRKYIFQNLSMTVILDDGFEFVVSHENNGHLLFAYYPIFNYGNKSTYRLKKFSERLRKQVEMSVIKKLSHNNGIKQTTE